MNTHDTTATEAGHEGMRGFAGSFSVRTKIIGIVLTLTTILGLGITWQVRVAMNNLTRSELDSRGQPLAIEIAGHVADPLSNGDIPAVVETLDRIISAHPDAVSADVERADGTVVATAVNTAAIEQGASNDPDVSPTDADSTYRYAAPIPGGDATLTVSLSVARLRRVVDGVTLQMLMTTLFVGAIGVFAASLLTWFLTRPIIDLVDATRRVGEGDLTARAPVASDDEIGALATAFNGMVEDLESSGRTIAATQRARTRLLAQLIRAQEDERKRIARELHDGVGQSLSTIMLSASLIARSGTTPDVRDQAMSIRNAAAESLRQARRLGRELRPSVLDDLGLTAALERYAAEFRLRYPEITTEFHSDVSERVPPVVETTMYRVTQEAMTNVARHSGARTLSVLVTEREGTLHAIIEDDGSGFDPVLERSSGQSVGIHGMVERVELLGGRLDIESSDTGTTIYAEVPNTGTGATT